MYWASRFSSSSRRYADSGQAVGNDARSIAVTWGMSAAVMGRSSMRAQRAEAIDDMAGRPQADCSTIGRSLMVGLRLAAPACFIRMMCRHGYAVTIGLF